jgi:Cdc6-like AAA superfamily ATPase
MARLVDRFNIPFSLQGIPVGNFVGREEQLHRIEQQLQPASTEKTVRKVFVVHGLGGIGKTRSSLETTRTNTAQSSGLTAPQELASSSLFWMP